MLAVATVPARPVTRRGPDRGVGETAAPVKGLRRRRSKDLGACARLLRVVFFEGQYPVDWPERPRAWLSDREVMDAWVVERRGEMLGHIAISTVGEDGGAALRWRELTGLPASELAAVSRLFVRARVRRQGIGTALLDVAASEIRARGLTPVLEVPGASTDAVGLLEHAGWRLRAMDHSGRAPDWRPVRRYVSPRDQRQTTHH